MNNLQKILSVSTNGLNESAFESLFSLVISESSNREKQRGILHQPSANAPERSRPRLHERKIRLLLTIPPNLDKQFSHLAIFGDICCMLAFMNKQEAAEFLGVSVRALERYVQQGRIGGHYEKGKTRPTLVFDKAELEAFKRELEEKIYKPAVEPPNPDNTLATFGGNSEHASFAILEALLERQDDRNQTPAHHKLLLTLTEAMALTGLSRTILREAISQGKLKAHIIGKSWRIKYTDLERYVEKLF